MFGISLPFGAVDRAFLAFVAILAGGAWVEGNKARRQDAQAYERRRRRLRLRLLGLADSVDLRW